MKNHLSKAGVGLNTHFIQKRGNGFSMLEAVVVVGVLLAIAVGGFISYGTIVENAKIAKLKSAASDVYTAVLVYEMDGDPSTYPKLATENYNAINSLIHVDLSNSEEGPLIGAMTTIKASNVDSSNGSEFCVTATRIDDSDLIAQAGNCDNISNELDDPPIPVIKDAITKVSYQCAATTTNKLPFIGADSSTKVNLTNTNSETSEMISQDPSKNNVYFATLQGGVKYTATLDGAYETFSHEGSSLRNCVTSVDQLGPDSGVKTLSYLGGNKVFTVPDQIPSSVTSLKNAFSSASNFNDTNVSNWNTFNVTDMSFVFYRAGKFDQSVDNWKTDNVTSMEETFSEALIFDQPLSKWETSNVVNMREMFASARKFSYPVGNWKVHNVENFQGMFFQAWAFNQPLGEWKTYSATDMASMFSEASIFNQDISQWDTLDVTSMKSMFSSAKVFNQDISNWKTGKVKDMNGMFYRALAFDQEIKGWNTESVTDMNMMFAETTKFQRNISGWNVAAVTTWTNFRNLSLLTDSEIPAKFI
jgi:surface protein